MSEFKNENVSVKLERLPGSSVKLEVAVSALAAKAAYEKAIKSINKEIVIPGFRKGKAPTHVILEKFKSNINEEFNSILVNTAFQDAVQLVKVYPFFQNSVQPEIKKISLEDGAEIIYTFEARPDVPEIDPTTLVLKNVLPAPITTSQIEERIYELQLNQATWDEVTTRAVKEGDFASLDIESLDSGVAVCKDQVFKITKDSIGGWLFDALIGKNVNETFEAVSEKECKQCDDHTHVHPEAEDFKPSNLKITVKSIKVPVLPEIDLEFAKKLGSESVETLNNRIVSSLENNAKSHAQELLRNQLEKAILEKYKFDVPLSMLESEGRNLDEKTLATMMDSLRMYFITQTLAAKLDISVTQDEIMEEFMIQAYMTNREESYINPKDDPKEINQQIKSQLIDRKIKDYLIERALKD